MNNSVVYTLDGLTTITADQITINGELLDMTLYVLSSYLESNNYTKTQINNIIASYVPTSAYNTELTTIYNAITSKLSTSSFDNTISNYRTTVLNNLAYMPIFTLSNYSTTSQANLLYQPIFTLSDYSTTTATNTAITNALVPYATINNLSNKVNNTYGVVVCLEVQSPNTSDNSSILKLINNSTFYGRTLLNMVGRCEYEGSAINDFWNLNQGRNNILFSSQSVYNSAITDKYAIQCMNDLLGIVCKNFPLTPCITWDYNGNCIISRP